ncbi:MAG: hypothetical protein UC208_00505 [Oscillospiraceae bacterium]|jgi:hypothetical protein|nr:hypothetical protein [Oscillospiraceae bacterium]
MDVLLSNIFTYIIADNPLVVNRYILFTKKYGRSRDFFYVFSAAQRLSPLAFHPAAQQLSYIPPYFSYLIGLL